MSEFKVDCMPTLHDRCMTALRDAPSTAFIVKFLRMPIAAKKIAMISLVLGLTVVAS